MTSEEKYNKLKKDYDDFVYIVSHDFKAAFRKLNSLTGWIKEDLESNDLDEVHDHIAAIQKTSKQMDAMLEGLTWISRVDRITDAADYYSIQTLSKEINTSELDNKLDIQFDSKLPLILSPKEKIFKVLKEIIKNAFDYNQKDSKTLAIRFESSDNFLIVLFSDNGDGIYNKNPDKVFDLFYNETFKTGIESPGYGLTYAQKLIESEGGSLSIPSTSAEGTTVQMSWPLDKTK